MVTLTRSRVFLVGLLVISAMCLAFLPWEDAIMHKHEQIDDLVHAVKSQYVEDKNKGNAEQPVNMESKYLAASYQITEYWQAAALIKWDWEKPLDYECSDISKAGQYSICQDPPYTIQPPCIAYSFGVNKDWRFEESLGARGCETHSFDPSLNMSDHIHKKIVHFHNMGIGAEDTDTFKPPRGRYVKFDQTWKLRTLPSIMKMLGHDGKVIDALKVDVEGYEWFMLEQMLETGIIHRVRQFIIEWHFFKRFPKWESYIKLLRFYYRMKDAGFRTFKIFFTVKGYSADRWKILCDAMYINTKFDPIL